METKTRNLLFCCLLLSWGAAAQNIGIGTTSPDASAILDVRSTTRGVLLPKMTGAQRSALFSPAAGLIVYQTDGTAGLYYNSGTPVVPAWERIATSSSVWQLGGNSGTTPGTHFIGTTDNIDLVFKAGGIISGSIGLTSETTSLGKYSLPSYTAGWRNTSIGANAMYINTTGNFNTANGAYALSSNTTGNDNTAIGYYAHSGNFTGSYNTALGSYAHSGSGNWQYSTGIGYATKAYANNATAIGAWAQADADNTLVLGSIAGVNGATNSVNVGIGTTSPKTRLQIVGGTDAEYNLPASGFLVSGDVNGANIVMDNNEIMARNNNALSTLFLQNDGGNLEVGGNAYKPGGGLWLATSDARLKKDVHAFTDGLAVLQQINPVWFRYNGKGGIKDTSAYVGIIAQEMQKVAPYMIKDKPHTAEDGTTENYLSYDANALLYVLVNALKEQQQQIEELKKMLQTRKD